MTALLLASVSTAWGGAWTKELGSAYVKGGADVYKALRFVAAGGEEGATGNYFAHQYGIYAEAGVLPMHPVQLSISAPLVVGVHNTEIFDAFGALPIRATTARLGDFRTALQVAVSKKVPLALAVEAKIPLYANDSVGADIPTFQPLFPKPGDGQLDLTGWVYGGAAPVPKVFMEGALGYMHRTEAFFGWDTDTDGDGVGDLVFVDNVRFAGKIGRSFGAFLPIVGFDGNINVAESETSREYVGASINSLIDVADGVAIEARFSGELWAKNTSQGIGGGVGLSWRK